MPVATARRPRRPNSVGREDGHDEWWNNPQRDVAWEHALTRTTHHGVDPGHGSQAHSSSRAVLPALRSHGGPERPQAPIVIQQSDPPSTGHFQIPPPPLSADHPPAAPAARRVHLVHDPSDADKDITVRLKMDVEEDWEAALEEFCHLRRLGRFKDATEYWWGSTLRKRSADPYVQVQYAEMLLAAGDYKNLRDLPLLSPPLQPPTPIREHASKLGDNYDLLRLLSHGTDPPAHDLVVRAVIAVMDALEPDHVHRSTVLGSTEIQLIALSLRAVGHAEVWAPGHHVALLKYMIADPRLPFRDWYRLLVGEGRVWDFRDLLVAAALSLGWEVASERFFGAVSDGEIINSIREDWERPGFDEGSTLGLLDLFTSLILQDSRKYLKARNSLLLQESATLAASIQHHHDDLMSSRPFVQFLLAKAALELDPAPPDSWLHGDSGGVFLYQGPGIQLPLYVPGRDGKKPAWETLASRSTPEQRRAVEVAAGMAHHLGDHRLHAQALKLLVLQSEAPHAAIGALANLQNKVQGDRQGYFSTNLSGYLVANTRDEQRSLLRILEVPDGAGNSLYFENLHSKPLRWAWAVIRVFLVASAGDAPSDMIPTIAAPYFEDITGIDVSELDPHLQDFSRGEFNIPEESDRHSTDGEEEEEEEDDGDYDLSHSSSVDSSLDGSDDDRHVETRRRTRAPKRPDGHPGRHSQPPSSNSKRGVNHQGKRRATVYSSGDITIHTAGPPHHFGITKPRHAVKFAPRAAEQSMPPPPLQQQYPWQQHPPLPQPPHPQTKERMVPYIPPDNSIQVVTRAARDDRASVSGPTRHPKEHMVPCIPPDNSMQVVTRTPRDDRASVSGPARDPKERMVPYVPRDSSVQVVNRAPRDDRASLFGPTRDPKERMVPYVPRDDSIQVATRATRIDRAALPGPTKDPMRQRRLHELQQRRRPRSISPPGTGFAQTVTSDGGDDYRQEEPSRRAGSRKKGDDKDNTIVVPHPQSPLATKHVPPAVEDDTEVAAAAPGGEEGTDQTPVVGEDRGVLVEEID